MTERYEWDFPATMRPRRGRRRRPLPLEGEILTAEDEPTSRITIEHRHVVHHHRQRQHIPPWAIAILIIGFLCWVSPLGTVIALFMVGAFVTAYPTIAIALAILLVLFIGIAARERLAGRPF